MTQTAEMRASLTFTQTATPDGGQSKIDQAVSFLASIANAKCDLGFVDKDRAIASGADDDVDLAGGLTGANGATITATKIHGIAIRALPTNTADLTLGGATAEALLMFAATGDKATLKPGDWFIWYSDAGWTITASTADDFRVHCGSGAGNKFDLALLGKS